jgi:hypothetical protein
MIKILDAAANGFIKLFFFAPEIKLINSLLVAQ